ncbi:MAG: ADP-forming succinate--CoA ligase subunit beta [Desulfurococcaceae archaeon]|uniref:Succinate--CoA ligase [ADP-forming] subunit beta n=1 Tax=Staphylothermus marinus TaxID=2280 RepID=A0A7C4JL48_STAMA
MKLYEYEAKEIVSKYGIPVPKGRVASNPDEARSAALEIGLPVVIKSQVLVGGRGLAGGIRFASALEEVVREASELLSSEIKGEKVEKILVEEMIRVEREIYLSLTIDRYSRTPIYLISTLGGVDIEKLVKEHPDKLLKLNVNPFTGYKSFYSRVAARFLELPFESLNTLDLIMGAMYRVMLDYDAELVEFNPLALVKGGGLVALDAKLIIDDNSLWKHPGLVEKYSRELSFYEKKARELGFSYVELTGDVGIIANGAGLTMATMDTISLYGIKPANFLDVGGGASADKVYEAVKLLLEHPRVKALLINIFGGITRCDEIARGVVRALQTIGFSKPIVVRMLGTNEEEGRRILNEKGVQVFSELEDAIRSLKEMLEG